MSTGIPDFGKTLPQIRKESPFPWRLNNHGNGTVSMLDAAGVEVPMFRVLACATIVTAGIEASQAKAA
jgi:hypothetical protein